MAAVPAERPPLFPFIVHEIVVPAFTQTLSTLPPHTVRPPPLPPMLVPVVESSLTTLATLTTEASTVQNTTQVTRTTTPYVPENAPFIPNEVPIPDFFPRLPDPPFQPTPGGGFTFHDNFSAPSLTSNNTIATITITCGEPGFCSGNIYENCPSTILSECQKCDGSLAAVLIFFIICLGIAIVLGNVLIILVGYHKYKHGKKEKNDLCKSSLAIADMIAGIQLLTVVVYNFGWSIRATADELAEYSRASRYSGWSFFAGTLLLFGFTSSVYHLFFMSFLRFLAVSFPLKYKFLRFQTVFWCLVVVWLVSAVAATLPVWFPNQIGFYYQVSLMLFYPAARTIENASAAIGVTSFFYLIPYLLMTLCSIATAIVIRRYQKNKLQIRGKPSQKSKVMRTEEKFAFVTILIMEAAFTVAMIPVLVVVVLFYNRTLSCWEISIPYIVAIYFSMTNSLVNVFIYNFREKNFRSTAKKILCFQFSKAFKIVSKEKRSSNRGIPFTLKLTDGTSAASNTIGSNSNKNRV